jgi:hypothetical protein
MRLHRSLLISLACLMSGGCATALPGGTPVPPKPLPADTRGTYDGKAYVLSDAEQKLDCKKLTGRMQVRILQIRDTAERPKPSETGQTAFSTFTTITGKPTYGSDPDRQLANDRAVLEAYNRQLAAKGCATYNLDDELRAQPASVTPKPVPLPPKTK